MTTPASPPAAWSGPLPATSELAPHQLPMLAIEELVAWRPEHATARMTVRADNSFVQGDQLDTVVTLEYMAQTVAACLGMEAYASGGNVRVGMVIACRSMQIHRATVPVGEVLTIQADCVRGSDSISHYDGEVRDASGELIAAATMTLVHGEKPPDQA